MKEPKMLDESKVIMILFNIYPLKLSDFKPEDNIIKELKDLLEAVVYNLGTIFDERIEKKLSNVDSLITELEYKGISSLKIPTYIAYKSQISSLIKSALNCPGLDQFNMSEEEMINACSNYIEQMQCDDAPVDIQRDVYKNTVISYISNESDKAYGASKDLLNCINSRIDYYYTHNVQDMKTYCLEGISFILFLLKYYAEINVIFYNILDWISLALNQNLDQCS